MEYKRTFWTMLAVLLVAAPVGFADPPTEDEVVLVNPAAPATPERLELPSEPPAIELASYWRKAPTASDTDNTEATHSEPQPFGLGQPAWLLPEPVELEKPGEPEEPSGPAVVVKDNQEPRSMEQDIELAMARFEQAPSRSSALLVVAREMAVESHTVGDFGDVIEQCHRALDANPDQTTSEALAKLGAWAYNRRGELLVEQGNEHDAFENFQEAVLLDNNCWAALHNRGVTLARYAKHIEALSDFNRVVDLAPEFTTARYNRAEVLSQMDRWEEAVEDYNVALESLGEEADLYAARGHALAKLGKLKAAVQDFNTAIRLNNNFCSAYLGRGNTYASQKMYEQAADDFEQALRIEPRSAAAYRSTAWLLATCPIERYRNGERAVVAARRLALLRGNEDPVALDTLAVAYAEAGDFAQAIPYEQQAIIMAKDGKDKKAYLARLAMFRQGQAYRTE